MEPRARVNLHSGSLGAYVPCFNNAATLRRAVESVQAQSVRPAEILVVDDGSADGSSGAIDGLPVRVVRHERNLGRGAARARAMRELRRHTFVLCVDAIDAIPRDFAARALEWMADERVAAVCGRITQFSARNVVERWRGRHLFKQPLPAIEHPASPPAPRRQPMAGELGRKMRFEPIAAADEHRALSAPREPARHPPGLRAPKLHHVETASPHRAQRRLRVATDHPQPLSGPQPWQPLIIIRLHRHNLVASRPQFLDIP